METCNGGVVYAVPEEVNKTLCLVAIGDIRTDVDLLVLS